MRELSRFDTIATEVAPLIGGPDNVTSVTSCTTRLRFVVRQESEVDFDALNATPGVLQTITAGGQVQVVIGTEVDEVRKALLAQPGWSGGLPRVWLTSTPQVRAT